MPETGVGISRRLLFKLAGATAAAASVVGHSTNKAAAHDLTPTDPAYHYDEYEKIVNRQQPAASARYMSGPTSRTRSSSAMCATA